MNKIYDYVTEKIIKELESGVIPWKRPWNIGSAVNYITGKSYQGINRFLLDRPGEYLTFNQIKELGGSIKKGSKANMVIYYNVTAKKVNDAEEFEDDKTEIKKYFVLRYYNVFHIDDVEGIESKYKVYEHNSIEEAENIIKNYADCPEISHYNPGKAFYRPSDDIINTPEICYYEKKEDYYSVLFHEMVHSTGHKSRLNRFNNGTPAEFGSVDYSKEELIAEMGAAMLAGKVGIECTLETSASYIQSWLKVLNNDKKFVVQAAAQAQKACNYIIGITEE